MLKTKINLQLFAEGVGSDGEATAETGAEVVQADDNNAELATQKQAENGSLATNETETFDSLIKGKYKEEYENAVKKVIAKRLKGSEQLKQKLEAYEPIIQAAKSRYGIDDDSKLAEAFFEDKLYVHQVALENGMSDEEALVKMRSDREQKNREIEMNANMQELKALRAENARREQFKQHYQDVIALQQTYGEFDVEELFKNDDFNDLLNKGVNVNAAFLVVNHDKIVNGVMQKTAEQVKQGVVNSIASGAKRPVENGSSGQGASITTIDVNSLTGKDIRAILKEVESGKKIKF